MSQHHILIGITGGIAAFKTAALASRLVQDRFDVTVVMTEAAEKFVGAATFAALTGRRVAKELFDDRLPLGAHIELARDADLLCVAPATADFLAKAAQGRADDLLSALYLCFPGPTLFAPAMNVEMWAKPAVQRNIKQLTDDGVQLIGPESGWLSCREQGPGRMADPDRIYDRVRELCVQKPDDAAASGREQR
jgi:phosphopantothenoylcysteine decarboxylase/phosphopantothenate--cysteine ligase